jgi:hypothetical protein
MPICGVIALNSPLIYLTSLWYVMCGLQLMAEAIEKERGRGGGEAMLRVANLEEQLRQVRRLI